MDYGHTAHSPGTPAAMSATGATPGPSDPKTVRFQLITPDSPHTTARLPMRVQIYPHDATDSIVTTVKNFYGLYSSPTSSKGVSFEDETGNTMIARYENFRDNMVVYVRVIEEPALSPSAFATRSYRSPPAMAGGEPFEEESRDPDAHPHAPYSSLHHLHHHQLQHHHNDDFISRPGSRTSRKRSLSPNSARGRRSASASTNSKNRSRSSKNRGVSGTDTYMGDGLNGYSSGDGAPGSATGRIKEQQPIGNTEISVENIVEGGRRKRAKFESSELPLFAPPQMPAATSNPSVSPARRSDHRPSLPFVLPGQNPFAGAGALHSPQNHYTHFGQSGIYATPGSDGRRTRASIGYSNTGAGIGVLPTPDPTVSSVSEEDKDVAMQLMRLGEISNFSYGRTSTSTQDDTFSGRADAASSTGATSDSDSDCDCDSSAAGGDESDALVTAKRKQRLDADRMSRKIYQSVENGYGNEADLDEKAKSPVLATISAPVPGLMAAPKLKKTTKSAVATNATVKPPRIQTAKPKPKPVKAKAVGGSMAQNGAKAKKASAIAPGVPMSASLPASRKLSAASNGTGVPIAAATAAAGSGTTDEDIADLSSKPRCQRCRKSKKGCDRQRPCGRCRDAGIPAELCISEDEGNGRKGRYGRHMGVPIKKDTAAASPMQPPPLPAQPAPAPSPISATATATTTTTASTTATAAAAAAVVGIVSAATASTAPATAGPPAQLSQTVSHLPYQLPPISTLGQLSQQPLLQKSLPSLLPPAPISATPILAPTIPAMAMASTDKNKKRKR